MEQMKGYFAQYFEKAEACIHALYYHLAHLKMCVAQGGENQLLDYFLASQGFNTRIQQNPLIIVYCESKKDVAIAYKIAIKHDIPVRVRAGGHDHEGESSGTNAVVIDVSKISHIEIDEQTGIAKIGAGNRFIRLTSELAKKKVMIAHGTCATVCITGFTLGGGWGPWTRKMGMNCESLKGATLMLGDGTIVEVDEKEGHVPDLLWALRGGGGMSYGIVTELRLQTFPLPKELVKFELHWNDYDENQEFPREKYPTLIILKAWEKMIKSDETSKLIGTNLKINARPSVEAFDYEKVHHNCCMYGYWEGDIGELFLFVYKYFPPEAVDLIIDGVAGSEEQYLENGSLMNTWDRVSFSKVKEDLMKNGLLDKGTPLPPDLDEAAPHKITSRLVNKEGLGDDGYEQLLRSLTSPLVFKENRALGLFAYVTLGAIIGDFYRRNPETNSAFPYNDKLYTIQYQTWWNTEAKDRDHNGHFQKSRVYDYINNAMDWIDAARHFHIPNTSGAFISFKDSSVPTRVYFDKSYERLKQIKIDHSRDPYNHLRSRKTIM
ncbi:MAG: FAD-binding oxidoreductase [Bacteroidia bacterium]